jgi:hypothetical protein
MMSRRIHAVIRGFDKGAIYKRGPRWHWARNSGGVETYPPGTTLLEVRNHIARLCRVEPRLVKLEKETKS